MPSTWCDLDAVPTSLLKDALDLLLLTLVKLVNLSLVEDLFIQQWKIALVKPPLKSWYGSNKYIISSCVKFTIPFKIVEKSVLLRFNRHCNKNNLMPDYQSAYRANFSCETALLKLNDDLLWAMEHQEVTLLVAIDLSAAFDTVDHNLLLSILSKKFGVVNKALEWFDSYLRSRRFLALIEDTKSKEIELPFSVPQGSCAGPLLYSAYASTLQEVTKWSGWIIQHKEIHWSPWLCEMITPTKTSFVAKSQMDKIITMGDLENCATRIKNWMDGNRLKMSDS